jgi:hypothetical protein
MQGGRTSAAIKGTEDVIEAATSEALLFSVKFDGIGDMLLRKDERSQANSHRGKFRDRRETRKKRSAV